METSNGNVLPGGHHFSPAIQTLFNRREEIEFFKGLTEEEILSVCEMIKIVNLDEGRMVFDQGDDSQEIYYILHGAVSISLSSGHPGVDQIVIAAIGQGALFGEMACITGERRSARATVSKNNTGLLCFRVSKQLDDRNIYAFATLQQRFSAMLSRRLMESNEKYVNILSRMPVSKEELVRVIRSAKDEVEQSPGSGLIVLNRELTEKLYSMTNAIHDDMARKEFIREVVLSTFNLGERDVVIFNRNKIVARIYQQAIRPPEEERVDLSALEKGEASCCFSPRLDGEQNGYLADLVEDKAFFFREVLEIWEEEKMADFVQEIVAEVVLNSEGRRKLHFGYLGSYADLDPHGVEEQLFFLFYQWLMDYLTMTVGWETGLVEEVLENPGLQQNLLRMVTAFRKEHRTLLAEAVVETLVQLVVEAEWKEIPAVVQEAIDGTETRRSIVSDGRHKMIRRADQLWTRVHQAIKNKNDDLEKVYEEIGKAETRLKSQQDGLRAMQEAKALTLEEVQAMEPAWLREVVLNEGGHYEYEKEKLRYLPSGPMTQWLVTLAEKSRALARTKVEEREFTQALSFFNSVHLNNAPAFLQNKQTEYSDLIPLSKKALVNAKAVYNRELSKGLERHDEMFAKLKKVMVENVVGMMEQTR